MKFKITHVTAWSTARMQAKIDGMFMSPQKPLFLFKAWLKWAVTIHQANRAYIHGVMFGRRFDLYTGFKGKPYKPTLPARTVIIASEPGVPALAVRLKAGEATPSNVAELRRAAEDKIIERISDGGINYADELSGIVRTKGK